MDYLYLFWIIIIEEETPGGQFRCCCSVLLGWVDTGEFADIETEMKGMRLSIQIKTHRVRLSSSCLF